MLGQFKDWFVGNRPVHSMKLIALTGQAYDSAGNKIGREALVKKIKAAGIRVSDRKMRGVDTLVASRDDTAKAIAARSQKIRVITYQELYSMI